MTTLSLRLLIPNVMLNGSLRKLELHFLENWHLLIRVKSGTGLDTGTAVQVIVTMQRTFKEGPRDKSRACSQVIGTLRKMEGRRRSWFFFPLTVIKISICFGSHFTGQSVMMRSSK